MHRWYVLYTKLHAERQVTAYLKQLACEVYFPTLAVAQPRRDRPLEKPFLPGYVFVHYDMDASGLSRLAFTPGLRGVVMFGGEPAIVPDADIARIRAQLAQPQLWTKHGVPLKAGDHVEILQEPFQDVDAVFDRNLTPAARVRVFLRYLEQHKWQHKNIERLVPLELDAHLVRKRAPRG